MGRSSPNTDDLCNEHEVNQRNGASRPEKISLQNANYLGKQNYDDGTGCISPQQNNDRNNNGKYAAQEQPINSNGEDFKMLNLRLAIIIGKTVQNGLQAMHGRKKTMQPCGPKHST
ncbi:10009_t:CDS:2 [Rhizophagus irregularis]|nr:10009_t:CDS:2 [Rhizophagus irregularis]